MDLNVKSFLLFLAALTLTLGILYGVSEYNEVETSTLPLDSSEVEVDTLVLDTISLDTL